MGDKKAWNRVGERETDRQTDTDTHRQRGHTETERNDAG